MPDVIYTCATGMSDRAMRPFFESLRTTDFRGTVVILVHRESDYLDNLTQQCGYQIRQRRVQRFSRLYLRRPFLETNLDKFPSLVAGYGRWLFDTNLPNGWRRRLAARLGTWFHHISSSRYFYYFLDLAAHPEYGRAMTSDLRDVLFQANPFTELKASGEFLSCFLEDAARAFGTCKYNDTWIRELYSTQVLEGFIGKPISCSGITLGSRALILDYLGLLVDELSNRNGQIDTKWGYDQGVHNYLLISGKLPSAEIFPNGTGVVRTVGEESADSIPMTPNGAVASDNGTICSVVHQFDRHEKLAQKLLARIGINASDLWDPTKP